MIRCQDLIRNCLVDYPDLKILVLAQDFPEALDCHPGPITYLGQQPPQHGFASRTFSFREAKTQIDLVSALAHLRHVAEPPVFDIVFIDHDHRLSALTDQIEHAIALSHSRTVFLFDDAVPPDIAMAGASPTAGWWVGEVWMLTVLLSGDGSDFCKYVIDLPPTGLLVVSGFETVRPPDISSHYSLLQKVDTTEKVQSIQAPFAVDPHDGSAAVMLTAAFDRCENHYVVKITPLLNSQGADRSMVFDEAEPWTRPSLAFLLDLSDQDTDTSRLNNNSRRLQSKCLDTFSGIWLSGFDSFIKGSALYSRTIAHADSVANRLIEQQHYSRTILRRRSGGIVVSKTSLASATRIPGSVFFGTPDEPDNWGMWLLYGVPSAYHFLRDRRHYDGYLTCLHHPWQRKLLHYLGIPDNSLVEHQLERTYAVAQMTLIRHDVRDLTISRSDRAIFLDVAEAFGQGASVSHGEKIFVSRLGRSRRSGAYRALTNEGKLCEALLQRGFSIIEPDTLEFPEQVRAFAGARVIVGLGGAGMFNVVFSRPGTKVVTIESSMKWVDSHVNMIASCDLECGVIIGQQDLLDATPDHKRWSLQIDAAVKQIEQFTA